jgi:hypothetical protein
MTGRKLCRACDGRGYFQCDCWPADCICSEGDETCFECEGAGFVGSSDYDYPDHADDEGDAR